MWREVTGKALSPSQMTILYSSRSKSVPGFQPRKEEVVRSHGIGQKVSQEWREKELLTGGSVRREVAAVEEHETGHGKRKGAERQKRQPEKSTDWKLAFPQGPQKTFINT